MAGFYQKAMVLPSQRQVYVIFQFICCFLLPPRLLAEFFSFEERDFECDEHNFHHRLPLICHHQNIPSSQCEEMIGQVGVHFNSRLTFFLSLDNATWFRFSNVIIVIDDDVDPRSTVYHLCLGLEATQTECATMQHYIAPYIPSKFQNMQTYEPLDITTNDETISIGSCTHLERQKSRAYFTQIFTPTGLVEYNHRAAKLKDKSYTTATTATSVKSISIEEKLFNYATVESNFQFAFSGSDDKVIAIVEAVFRSNVHWPKLNKIEFIDVGAHRGGFISDVAAALSNLVPSMQDDDPSDDPPSSHWVSLLHKSVSMLSFEPTPASFTVLKDKVEKFLSNSNTSGGRGIHTEDNLVVSGDMITLVRAALSDKTNLNTGFIHVPLEVFGSAAAELSTLAAHSVPNTEPFPTLIWSLDDYLSDANTVKFNSNVEKHHHSHHHKKSDLFLKIDVEGFDPLVLQGASQLLSGKLLSMKRPTYILFEYSQAWTVACDSSEYRLETVVNQLAGYGYKSYLLGPHQLMRLDGSCWCKDYEFWSWSNVFAVYDGDEEDGAGLLQHQKSRAIIELYAMIISRPLM
jgi:hypothetical protein